MKTVKKGDVVICVSMLSYKRKAEYTPERKTFTLGSKYVALSNSQVYRNDPNVYARFLNDLGQPENEWLHNFEEVE